MPPESTVNWPGRRREEGGSELIAHIRVIQVLPVADNWIDEDAVKHHLFNSLTNTNVAFFNRMSLQRSTFNVIYLICMVCTSRCNYL